MQDYQTSLDTSDLQLFGFDSSSGRPVSLRDSLQKVPAASPELAEGDSSKRREKNRVAQSRYRALRKEAQQRTQQHLQGLEQSIQELQSSNLELATRERSLSELAFIQEAHINQMATHKAILDLQQNLLLREAAIMMCIVYGRTISSEEVMNWSLESWIRLHFESYLNYLAAKMPAAQADPGGPDAQELVSMTNRRREVELKLTLFSCLHLALLAWNLVHGPSLATAATRKTWEDALVGLRLTSEQEQQILGARQGLLQRLTSAQEQRLSAYAALRQEAQEQLRCTAQGAGAPRGKARGEQLLEAALQTERKGVETFLTRVCGEVLGPLQEAWLDACSGARPWTPDWWALGEALAARHSQPAAPDFQVLREQPLDANIAQLMPIVTAFRLLVMPCTALGCGNYLKRSLLACTFLTAGCLSPLGVAYQMPSMASLDGLTLYEAQAGKYREQWASCAVGIAKLLS